MVQLCDREFGVFGRGLLKICQRFFEELLVHVGDAEIILAGGFDEDRGVLGLRKLRKQPTAARRLRPASLEIRGIMDVTI